MEKPNEHFDVQFTKDELRMLVRLVGHHVCGSAVDGIYNKLFDALFVHGQRASAMDSVAYAPFKAPKNHPYGDRPVIKIDGHS